MPSHFDRFRYLNGGRFRNDSEKVVYVSALPEDPHVEVPPGAEVDPPKTPEGDFSLHVPVDEPVP